MSSIIFRGAELRAWTGKTEEGGPVHRLKFLADLSRPAAEGLGCEEDFFEGDFLRNFTDNVTRDGRRNLTFIRLEPNGMPQHTLEIPASLLEYEIYTKQARSGDADDPPEYRIRLSITTVSELYIQYARFVGTQGATLKAQLSDEAQQTTIFDADEATPEPAKPEPAVASAREMKETAKAAGRRERKEAAADGTTVQ